VKQAGGAVTGCGSITADVRAMAAAMAALLVRAGLGIVKLSDWHPVARKQKHIPLGVTLKISGGDNHSFFYFFLLENVFLTCLLLTNQN